MGFQKNKDIKLNRADARDFYEYSLGRIFWQSSVPMLILGFVCMAIIFIVMLFARRWEDMGKILVFFALLMLCVVFIPPILSLLRALEQEAALGIKYKNRADFKKDKNERDWYVDFVRGGFVLYHRNFIKRIIRSVRDKEIAYVNGNSVRSNVYILSFEDINRKKRKIKFSAKSEEQAFRAWYRMGKSGRRKRETQGS
jgi:hypothetical protein